MSTNDGFVQGNSLIHGKGGKRSFSIVLLADGFQEAQQDTFNDAAKAFAENLLQTAPFDRLAEHISIYRVNVISTDAGADRPPSQPGLSRRTFFDSTFGTHGIARLTSCNNATAKRVAVQHVPSVPHVDLTIVVINSIEYGGGGGPVPTCTLFAPDPNHPWLDPWDVAMHEAGHSAFGLADEYDHVDNDVGLRYFGPERPEPNITARVQEGADKTAVNLERLKWRWAWTPDTRIPTTSPAANCSATPATTTLPTGTVGAFAGGHRHNCGIYRPEFNCRMRNAEMPFCKVCQQHITNVITSRVTLTPRARTPVSIVARDAGQLDVFAVDSRGRTMTDWWGRQQGWSGWTQINGGTAGSGSPVTALPHSSTHVSAYTVITPRNQVAVASWSAFSGWTGWDPIPGLTARPFSRFEGHVDLFTVRPDGQVMTTWLEPGMTWMEWFPVSDGIAGPGSPVTAASRFPEHIDLYTVRPDGRVWTAFWVGDGPWSGWFPVGNDMRCRPGSTVTAVVRDEDHLELFTTAADGAVMTIGWRSNGGWHSTWTDVSGGVASAGSPVTALSRRPDLVEVFVLGTDERVYTTEWTERGRWRTWWDVVQNGQGLRDGQVAAVSRDPATIDLVVTGTDGVLWTTARGDGSPWDMWTPLSVT
ncbi:MAG: M64 family metallopeptidase [Nocardioidaceae bacterium]